MKLHVPCNKMLEDFKKMTEFYKSFRPFFSKSLHIHFNPSQNVFPILLLQWFGDSYK